MATAANWLSNFVVIIITPALFAHTLWRTYILFAVTNFCIVPIIYFFYPETGSRSLEEVDVVFKTAGEKAGNPWLQVVREARDVPRWFDKNGEPTDSYGSGSEKSEYDPEKGGSASGDNTGDDQSPDSGYRFRPSNSSNDPRFSDPANSANRTVPLRLSDEEWDSRGPAPAPFISRTSSRPGS